MEAKIEKNNQRASLIVAGIILGLGLGGFFDGITIWDGLFHAFDWIMTVIGVVLLWRAGRRQDVPWSSNIYFGSILMGAGLFNLVEGVIDHHILGIHHVKPGSHQLAWDLGFLAVGALLVVVGWVMVQKREQNLEVKS